MNTRVGVVCLGEAANLGDDLILVAVVRSIYSAAPKARIDFLSHGAPLPWREIAAAFALPGHPHGIRVKADLGPINDRRRTFAESDIIVFGGGGLLQSSHQPDPVYEWLSYLPTGEATPPVLAIGHGIGPLSERWIRRLAALGPLFSESWVRDSYSLTIATDRLRWPSMLSTDFVTPDLIRQLTPLQLVDVKQDSLLGVALRSWPGLAVADVAEHVRAVADRHGCKAIHYWVLEGGSATDARFVDRVMTEVDRSRQFKHIYSPSRITEFLGGMSAMTVAISMKLHSSVIWDTYGVPMYPILYAPKVASFFGFEWQGLKVLDRPVAPLRAQASIPQASTVLAERLSALVDGKRVRRSGLTPLERARFQFLRLLNSLCIRLPYRMRGMEN